METNFHDALNHLTQLQAGSNTGLISISISFLSATLAFFTGLFDVNIKALGAYQPLFAIAASLVAIVSGGFAIYYYRLQIRKLKNPTQ